MAFFKFAEGSAMFDSTPIENLFLMEHLSTAPEGCLRVYLYARMLALHPELGGDLAETAQFLHMEEKAVYDAFDYWERQGLVRRLSDRPPTYELLPLRSDTPAVAVDHSYYVYRDFNASLQSLFGKNLMEPHDYRIANDWLNVLGYDQEAVLKLVEYGIRTSRSKDPKPRSVFERMNRQAALWADRGCRTVGDLERVIAEQEDVYPVAKAVLKRFSLRRDPTLDEVDLVKKWMGEWRLTEADILSACAETTKASKPSFAYVDAVLKSRREGGGELWGELTQTLRELDSPQAQPTQDMLERYAALRSAGFDAETIRLAAVQCHRKKKTRFEELEWMLKRWGDQGLFTPEAARDYVDRMRQKAVQVRRVLEESGLERRPTMGDIALYDGWLAHHDPAVIEYAARCARGMQMPMKYMDKLLEAWRKEGVATVEAARASHEAAGRARGPSTGGKASGNPALDYQQREYKDEDFGDDFFLDLDRFKEGGYTV
ncbi:MAG: DnaD domain protein [Clostridia bacterium]|nr:DnaD domain protein [Clostridia bacterium]